MVEGVAQGDHHPELSYDPLPLLPTPPPTGADDLCIARGGEPISQQA